MEQEIDSDIILEFQPSGRGKARCPSNPEWPNGKDLDVSKGEASCKVDLPYPAEECGTWILRCAACGLSLGVTAAGRPDDPKSIKVPCMKRATISVQGNNMTEDSRINNRVQVETPFPSGCQCYECLSDKYVGIFPVTGMRMVLCEHCGNKRCPHATDHNLPCTNSNEPGQKGSRYE